MSGDGATSSAGRVIDGHRLSEFVYGTITGMAAIAAIGTHPERGWLSTAVAVVAGAVAIWLAHAYAILLSKRVTAGRRLTVGEIGRAFYGSWSIVTAGVVLALPIVATGIGLWGLETGVAVAGYVGIALLLSVGLMAGSITRETWPRRILIAAVYGGLGIAIVAIEYIVKH